MTEEDLSRFQQFSGRTSKERLGVTRKYRNTPTSYAGVRFDSKAEAKRYSELMLLQAAGEISYVLRQIPFHLPGGVIYRVDFMVVREVMPRGHVLIEFEDVKGYQNRESMNKIKQAQAIYKVKISLLLRRT